MRCTRKCVSCIAHQCNISKDDKWVGKEVSNGVEDWHRGAPGRKAGGGGIIARRKQRGKGGTSGGPGGKGTEAKYILGR